MSLTAYGCGFDFKISSVTYMLYLMYYRAARCYSHIDWPILNGVNSNRTTPQPVMPTETEAVFRTLIFTLFYLVIGILLVITCIMAFCESPDYKRTFHLILIFVFVSGTPTNWKVKTPDLLVVLCTIYFHLRDAYRNGSLGFGILSC